MLIIPVVRNIKIRNYNIKQKAMTRMQIDLQRKIFDKKYKKYRSYSLSSWHLFYLKRIFNRLNLKAADRLLDIGVGGNGYTVIEAAGLVSYVCGIDISEGGIKKAIQFSNDKKVTNVDFIVSSAESLPFKDSSFDKIVSIAVLEHIEEDGRAIDEMSRVLSTGGKIHICVPNSYS